MRGLSRRPATLVPGVDPVPVDDLLNEPALVQACSGSDVVIHLAARVHLPDGDATAQQEHDRVNTAGTRAVANAAIAGGAKRVLFMSSVAAVAGLGMTHLNEASVPAPSTAYGRSKLAAERALLEVCATTTCEAVILRPPLVYGPEMPGNPQTLFRLIARGIPIPSPRPSALRSVLYVGNLCDAVLCVLREAGVRGAAFFVRDQADQTVDDWCRLIGRALGRQARLLPVPRGVLRAVGLVGDVISPLVPHPFTTENMRRFTEPLTVDDMPLRRQAGYTSPWSAADALALTAEWFRNSAK